MLNLNEAAILAKLEAINNTDKIKRKKEKVLKQHQRDDEPFANGEYVIGPKAAARLADALVQLIKMRLPESIREVGNSITCGKPYKSGDGYHVAIHFDKNAIYRDSLENDDPYFSEYNGFTGEGIENIVALFNNGYNAGGNVYGWWQGHRPTGEAFARSTHGSEDYSWVKSVKSRDPMHFMQDAVEEFNTMFKDKYGGVQVMLGSDYTDFKPRR